VATEYETDMSTAFVDSNIDKIAVKLFEDLVTDPQANGSHKERSSRRALQLLSRANVATIPEYYWSIDSFKETKSSVTNATTLAALTAKSDYYGRVYAVLRGIATRQPIDPDLFQLTRVYIPFDLKIESLLRCLLLLTLLKGTAKYAKVSV